MLVGNIDHMLRTNFMKQKGFRTVVDVDFKHMCI